MDDEQKQYPDAYGNLRTRKELVDEYNMLCRLQGQQALAGIQSARTARMIDAARDALRRANDR
jgi:hypothetical protein